MTAGNIRAFAMPPSGRHGACALPFCDIIEMGIQEHRITLNKRVESMSSIVQDLNSIWILLATKPNEDDRIRFSYAKEIDLVPEERTIWIESGAFATSDGEEFEFTLFDNELVFARSIERFI